MIVINGLLLKIQLKKSMLLNYQNLCKKEILMIKSLKLNILQLLLKNVLDSQMVHSQLVMLNMKNQEQQNKLLTGTHKIVLLVINVL